MVRDFVPLPRLSERSSKLEYRLLSVLFLSNSGIFPLIHALIASIEPNSPPGLALMPHHLLSRGSELDTSR